MLAYICCFLVVIVVRDVPRQTEVGNFQDVIVRNEDISCRQITMDALEK